jgi:hypothetical protein
MLSSKCYLLHHDSQVNDKALEAHCDDDDDDDDEDEMQVGKYQTCI